MLNWKQRLMGMCFENGLGTSGLGLVLVRYLPSSRLARRGKCDSTANSVTTL